MEKWFWQSIRTNDYSVPDGHQPIELTPELLGYLGSTDPELRDTLAYTILSYWIERGYYLDDELRGLAMQMVANMGIGLGESETDTVFLRSFSALLLADIVDRDNANPFMSDNEIKNLLRWTLEYFKSEVDFRGYVPEKGWAHAMAHTADLLRKLARNRHLQAGDLERILNAIADKLTTPAPAVLVHNEDDRLVLVVWAALQRQLLAMPFLVTWMARLVKVMNLAGDGETFDATHHAAWQNTRGFLRALYFRLAFAKGQPELIRQLRPKVLAAVKAVHG